MKGNAAMPDAYIRNEGTLFLMGNRRLERKISIACGRLTTTSLCNKLTRRSFRTCSAEFLLRVNNSVVLTNRDFVVRDTVIRNAKGATQKLAVTLSSKPQGLALEVTYALGPDDFYMRKYLKVLNQGDLINEIHVEEFLMRGVRSLRFGGFGQPLFVDRQLFLGLEYPAGYNVVGKDKTISLKHFPGRNGEVVSKKAVIGVCPDTVNNRVKDWFLKYVDENRARPIRGFFKEFYNMQNTVRYTDINSWCFDEAKELLYDQGIRMDSLMLCCNDHWVEPQSIMKEMPAHKQAIPLPLLKKEGKEKTGAELGVHVNTAGGRSSADHQWFAEHFDMISAKYYCMADPRVKEELKKNLLQLVKKYGVAMYSFDWVWLKTALECPKANHRGHIKGVRYSREAITDAYIELLQALREANPDIVLQDIEAEHSPWWLLHSEALAGYAGEGSDLPHEYVAGKHRGWLKKNTVFPMSDIWDPSYHPIESGFGCGIPKRKGELDFREFLAAAILPFMTGSQVVDVNWYLRNFNDKERDAYVRILKWGLARQDIFLASSTFILGDPAKAEVYGYSHFRGDNRGIIGIYNPAHWQSAKAKIVLDEKAHFRFGKKEPCIVKTVYPYQEVLDGLFRYGDSFEVTVPGSGLMVFEIIPRSQTDGPVLAGCRYKVLDNHCCQLLGMPGQKKHLRLFNPENGQPLQIDGCEAEGNEWEVEIHGQPHEEFEVQNLQVQAMTGAGGGRPGRRVKFGITIPENERVRLRFLTDLFFEVESLTEVEGEELEKAVHERMTRMGKAQKERHRQAYRNDLGRAMFYKKCSGAVASTLTNNGREIGTTLKEVGIKALISVGRHPDSKSRAVLRTWGTSEELSSGEVEFALRVDRPEARTRLWLDKEIALTCCQKVEFRCPGFDREDLLVAPDEWQDKTRDTMCLVPRVEDGLGATGGR